MAGLEISRLSNAANKITAALLTQRPISVLLIISFALGAAYTLTMFSVPLILGQGPFWDFPRGIVPGGANDMANPLVGYLYFTQAPWTTPLLQAPNIGAPAGTNVFWLDAIPWVSLLGKLVFTLTGARVNLLGLFVFACFTLPGVAMTALFGVAGQRSLIAAIAGTAFADAMPFRLAEWGHPALCGQFLIILAFALYLAALRHPTDRRVTAAWLILLSLTLLTHIYLFVMVGGIWAATLAQKLLSGLVSARRFLFEAGTAIGVVVFFTVITGILSRDLASAGADGFGTFSLNLASPFIPQMSGLIPPLSAYRIGIDSQVFGYLGFGVLAALALSVPGAVGWVRRNCKHHIALIGFFIASWLFALSNRVLLGSHVITEIPLSERAIYALGTFRASGRFFWPVGYALAAGGVILILKSLRPRRAAIALAAVSVLQLVDADPVRLAVAASALQPAPALLDRPAITALVDKSSAVMVFPSYGCVEDAIQSGDAPDSARAQLFQANMEIQLAAARANRPINSVFNGRLLTDCSAEIAAERQKRQNGTLYFYLTPGAAQGDGSAFDDSCSDLDRFRYCAPR